MFGIGALPDMGIGPHTYEKMMVSSGSLLSFRKVAVEFLMIGSSKFVLHLDADRDVGHAIGIAIEANMATIFDSRSQLQHPVAMNILSLRGYTHLHIPCKCALHLLQRLPKPK